MDIAAAIICAEMTMKELLDSSSSSDEEFNLNIQDQMVQTTVKDVSESMVYGYSEIDFKNKFRISRESASYLIEKYSQSYSKRIYQGGRLQTSLETQILAFLWFCGNKTTFREVSNIFELSISNVHSCFNNVLNFLAEDLAPQVIKFPKLEEEKEAVANEFKKISGIPNILGCIDGSYINIRTPKHKMRSTYANRHDRVSITLQGICDAKLRFLDVFTGVPSKIDDSRVLELSFIGKELPSLCSAKYYLLGDSAYPLMEYLLTPFIDYGDLSDSEKNYNTSLFRTRVKIENAFRALKWRFRQLMRIDFHNVDTMAKFVTACCVLHNICIERNESLPEEVFSTELNSCSDQPMESDATDILLTRLGKMKRNELKDLLFNSKS